MTTVIGLLTSWWKDRPAFLAPRRRYRTLFGATVAVGVALAVVQALILAPHSPSGAGSFLDQVPVELGGNNITANNHSVVIGCATGTPTDQFRDVRYVLLKRYTQLHTRIGAQAVVPDGSLVQLRLYRDSQPPVERTVAVGKTIDFDLDLSGVDRLLIRVTCQSPAASAILGEARLRHI